MNNYLPLVSVLLINYNGKEFIKECLDSISEQSYPKEKIEIIFVDNVSTDDSCRFVEEFYPAARILRNTVNNYCKAVNLGINESKSPYVALVNCDTRLDKNWLSELVNTFGKDTKIASAGSKILTFDGKIQNAGHYELANFYWGERGAGLEADKYNEVEEVSSLCGAAVLHRKSALLEAGLFDEDFIMYGEDVDISLRLRQSGFKLVFVPTSIAYHKFHGSGNDELSRYYIERNRLLYLAKHYPTKLSSALIGSGYFTAKRSFDSYGKLYSILPDIINKIVKTHPSDISNATITSIFEELYRINNCENDELIRQISDVVNAKHKLHIKLDDLERSVNGHEKVISVLRDAILAYRTIIAQKDKDINEKEMGIKERDNSVRELNAKCESFENILQHKERSISESQERIESLKGEINQLNSQLHQRIDECLIKDGQIIEQELIVSQKETECARLRTELNGIYSSEGYRLVLRSFWDFLLYLRRIFVRIKQIPRKAFWFIGAVLLSPAFLLLGLSLYIENIFWKVLGPLLCRTASDRKNIPVSEDASVTLVMPNYNGRHILEKSLLSVFSINDFASGKHEVLVIDDASTDGSIAFIKEHYPSVRIIKNKSNKKFGNTCNTGIKQAKNEIIVLVNNDIILTDGFLRPLLKQLESPDVFVATPKMFGWDKKSFVWGMHMGRFEKGYIRLWNECETGNGDRVSQVSPSIFAIGGAMVFRKSDFLWLGSFDHIYRPNCWEDIDISYRAWKRGLKVLYEPASLIYHKGRATLTYERPKEIKNELLFIWKNITDPSMLREHINLLPQNMSENGANFIKGFLWAICYLPQAILHRLLERRYVRVEDRKIFDHCMNYYSNFERRGYKHLSSWEKKNILLVTSSMPYPVNKGGAVRVNNLVKRLGDKYNIYLLTLVNHENEKNNVDKLKQIFKEVYTVFSSPDRINSMFPRRYRFSYSPAMIELLKEIQKNLALDCIHIESNELLYLLDYIKHVPTVYTEHDSSVLFFKDSYYRQMEDENILTSFFDYLKRLRFHAQAYKKINEVIVLSEKDRSILKSFFPDKKFILITTGVDLSSFSYSPNRSRPKRLIFVGHYLHYPNEESVLYFVHKVLPKLRLRIPDIEFMIVGSCPSPKIKQLSYLPNVKVIGEVGVVSESLRNASIFINPIRSSWGIKGKVLEAMAVGLPVVSTSKGAAGIVAKNGCGVVIADTPNQFVRAIEKLLNDNEFYRHISNGGRAIVSRFYDWDNIADSLAGVYERVTNDVLPNSKYVDYSFVSVEEVIRVTNKTVQEVLDKGRIDNNPVAGPRELHIELDYACNSKCVMCDLWDFKTRFPSVKPLTIEEIKDFADKSKLLKDIRKVVLSGGEPFLRSDIVDIAGYLLQRFPGASLGILTNGIDTHRIIKNTKMIVKKYCPKDIWLGSSLDGIEEAHDSVRGTKGAFENLKKTIRLCKSNSIPITLTYTLTSQNFEQVPLVNEFAKNAGVDLFIQFAVPKVSRPDSIFQLSDEQLDKIRGYLTALISEKIKDIDFDDFTTDPFQDRYREISAHIYYLSNLVKYYKKPFRYFRQCIMGNRFAMLSPHGEVYFCSGLKDEIIGNIREEGFDSIWLSEKAHNTRKLISKELCHCWLVCIVLPIVDEAWDSFKKSGYWPLPDRFTVFRGLSSKQTGSSLKKELSSFQQQNSILNSNEYSQGKIRLESTPKALGIGTHGPCNAKCVFCNSRYADYFHIENFKDPLEKKLSHVMSKAESISLCGAGELLLVPKVEEFLLYLENKYPHVNKIITTNGSVINDSIKEVLFKGKYSVQISLHASNKELHKAITRLDSFDLIIRNIEKLISARSSKSKPYLTLKFVINALNIENLPGFVELAGRLGVDEVFCDYMVIPTAAHLKLSCFFKQETTNRMFDIAKENSSKFNVQLHLPPRFGITDQDKKTYSGFSRCSDLWEYFYVETEGFVTPCCIADKRIGYLNNTSFEEIWNGDAYVRLREALKNGFPKGQCQFCYKFNPANINNLHSHIIADNKTVQDEILKDKVYSL